MTLRQVATYADACNFGASSNTGAFGERKMSPGDTKCFARHCDELGRPYERDPSHPLHVVALRRRKRKEVAAKREQYFPNGLTEEQQYTRIFGTPDQIVTYCAELVDAGVQYFVMQTQDASDVESIELLGREVAPRVRALATPK